MSYSNPQPGPSQDQKKIRKEEANVVLINKKWVSKRAESLQLSVQSKDKERINPLD